MSDEVLLSVVVPVYDVDPWLSECLDSIQRQIFTQWECILVDDGSKDGTLKAVEKLQRKDKRVKIVQLKRNFGHEIAMTAAV